MSRFIETLHLNNGHFLNIGLHQDRVNKTFEAFFPDKPVLDLIRHVNEHSTPSIGRFRCTLRFSEYPEDFQIIPYTPKKISRLFIKQGGSIDYSYKYADRSELNSLLMKVPPDAEIIILKDGWVTDASYANLVFYDGVQWYTPSTPLLNGTKRQLLLQSGKILETEVKENDLRKFQKCSPINAMLDPGDIEIDCKNIF